MRGASAVCVMLAMLLASCQRQEPSPAATATSIPLRLASWHQTASLIAGQQGKVVVLDVWSTWCGPCIEEFPGLVELDRKHPGKVACLSLNCNYTGAEAEPPGSERKQIEAFLTQQGATFENLICTDPDEKLFETLEAAAIPIVRVYDRQGKLRKQFDNDDNEYGEKGFHYKEHIAPLVEQLLSEP